MRTSFSKIIVSLIMLASTQVKASESVEAVYGFIAKPDSLVLSVFSGGCTSKKDFRFVVESEGAAKKLLFIRLNPDECLAFFPTGATLRFSYDELGLQSGDHFRVTNPIRDSFVW